MASLTGTKIKNTYDSLLKTTDNEPLDGTLKTITDGLGNNSTLSLSTSAADIGGTLSVQGATSLYSDLSVVGDYVSASGDISLANGDFIIGGTIYAASNIAHLGDTDTYINFDTNQITVYTGASARFNISDSQTSVYNTLYAQSTLSVAGNYTSIDGDISLANGDISLGGNIYVDGNVINKSDLDTSIAFGTNQISLITGGLTRLSVSDASVQVTNPLVASSTLAVTGDAAFDTNTLFVDASNNRVGIGTSSPDWNLHIKRSAGSGYAIGVYSSDGDELGGFYEDSSNNSEFYLLDNTATAKVLINSSGNSYFNGGNVGIGASPHSSAKLQVTTSGGALLTISNTDSGSGIMYGKLRMCSSNSSEAYRAYGGEIASYSGAGIDYSDLRFYTANGAPATERMRITSGGSVGIGVTSWSDNKLYVVNSTEINTIKGHDTNTSTTSDGIIAVVANRNTTNNTFYAYSYYNIGSAAFRFRVADSGNVTNTNNSYGAISDIKLKENIVDATPKLNKLMDVRVVNYNFIGDDKKQLGVVAQELEEVFPSMIDESPDFEERQVEVRDEEGNIVYKTEQVLVSEAVEAVYEEVIHPAEEAVYEEVIHPAEDALYDAEGNVVVPAKEEWIESVLVSEAKEEWIEQVLVTPAQDAVYETITLDEPEMTTERFDLGTVTKSVKYSVFVPMLIKAIQEQQDIIDGLKARIEALESLS